MKSTTEPITDSESLSTSPPSFDPIDGDGNSTLTVTIEHHNGVEEVSDFVHIEELDRDVIRVWHDDIGPSYTDYHVATITEVSP